MKLLFFEDSDYTNYYPLTLSRPVYMLLLGTSRIYQKWVNKLNPSDYSFICRDYLSDILSHETGKTVNEIPAEDFILINGRFIPDDDIISSIKNLKPGNALISNDKLIACCLSKALVDKNKSAFDSLVNEQETAELVKTLKSAKIQSTPLNYLWDFVNRNSEQITKEFEDFSKQDSSIDNSEKSIHTIGKNIFVDKTVSIAPAVVLDASDGPIIIDKGTVIDSFSHIQGPCYIGPNCRIVGGKIREGCSFGPVCRIGGEVEESIMQGYDNKYHEGFLGHAYLGEWVNLGALTTNSDLKNNYKNIKTNNGLNDIDTGSMKVGCFIGDHSKTGIGTMLNTGISIGFSCNIYGGALFTDKYINSFSWGTPDSLVEYQVEKAIETAKASMSRRNVEFTAFHAELFNNLSK